MPIERHGLNLDAARDSGRVWNRETAAQRQIAANREQGAAENEFGFWDFVDIINPLQHIPVVSTIYRHLTGDEIDPAAQVIGGTLYGGPIGLASSLVNVVAEEATGQGIGETALAMLTGEEGRGGPDAEPVVSPGAVLAMAPTTAPEQAAQTPAQAVPQPSAESAARSAARSAVAAPATTVPAEVQPAEPPPMQTAVLPNGFALRAQDWRSSRFFQSMPAPPEIESPAPARTIAAAPGEAAPIDGGLDAALSALAGASSPPEAPAEEAATAAPSADSRVPDAQIPDAMMRALDLYRQSRPSAPPAGASPIVPGLDIAA